MDNKRILVIGSPGSGKSTLSRKLAESLGLPLVHLDKLFWKSGWVESAPEEFDKRLVSELEKKSWIIDGNYERTMTLRLQYADTVVFFDRSRLLCAWRIIKRVVSTYGKVRDDMGEGCPEKIDLKFLLFVWGFRDRQRKIILELLSKRPDLRVITIRNSRDERNAERLLLQ